MNIDIYFLEMKDTFTYYDLFLMTFLSKERQTRINNMHFSIDKRLSLYSEILVRWRAMQVLDVCNEQIIFETNEYGKPYIKGYSKFYFNISHTCNALVIAFADYEIGVDVERVQNVDYNIAKRFFTPNEIEYIQSSINQNVAFCEIWTRKEAYIKYLGIGLSKPLKSFDVLCGKLPISTYIDSLGQYIISVCSEEK